MKSNSFSVAMLALVFVLNSPEAKAQVLSVNQRVSQADVQLEVCITGATPNAPVTLEAINIPLTQELRAQAQTDGNGRACYNFTVVYSHSWCELTPLYRNTPGIARAMDISYGVIAQQNFSIRSFFTTPQGGETYCPNNFTVSLQTGGDDLRDGSWAYIRFHFQDGRYSEEFPLNEGANWGNSSWHSVEFPTGGFNPDDIAGVTISHDGQPRRWSDTYDNWNVDYIKISYNYGITLIDKSDTPLKRFTGDVSSQYISR